MELVSVILAALLVVVVILYLLKKTKVTNLEAKIKTNKVESAKYKSRKEKEFKEYESRKESEFKKYKEHANHLMQYEQIDDAVAEAKKIISEAEKNLANANSESTKIIKEAQLSATTELKEARAKEKELREKAENKLSEAHEIASSIERNRKRGANASKSNEGCRGTSCYRRC